MYHLSQIIWKDGLPKNDRATTGKMYRKIGVNMFKERRQNLRFCDIPFPCFSNHALHIEVDISLDVHSLLLATNRFMAKKGAVHLLWLDNGANFVGAKINCSKNSRKYSWIK